MRYHLSTLTSYIRALDRCCQNILWKICNITFKSMILQCRLRCYLIIRYRFAVITIFLHVTYVFANVE